MPSWKWSRTRAPWMPALIAQVRMTRSVRSSASVTRQSPSRPSSLNAMRAPPLSFGCGSLVPTGTPSLPRSRILAAAVSPAPPSKTARSRDTYEVGKRESRCGARGASGGGTDEEVRARDRRRRPDRRARNQVLPRVRRGWADRSRVEGTRPALPPAGAVEALPARRDDRCALRRRRGLLPRPRGGGAARDDGNRRRHPRAHADD